MAGYPCCCGPCEAGTITDTFSGATVNPRWAQAAGGAGGIVSINSGRMRLAARNQFGRKRCHNPPTTQTVVTVEIDAYAISNCSECSLEVRNSEWHNPGGFGFQENTKQRAMINPATSGNDITGGSGAPFNLFYNNYVGSGTEATNGVTTPRFSSGNRYSITVTDIGSGLADIVYKVDGTTVATHSSKPWVWDDRIYVEVKSNRTGASPPFFLDHISEWDNYSLIFS